jgi:FAD/FMN-containing dehydrogenase
MPAAAGYLKAGGAAPHGLAPLVGSAASVGVAGYLSGGGIGPLVSTYGLSSDYVRSLDLVTGDGQIRHVTPAQYPDLFWGLRGGKATLGIITAVELDLLPVSTIYGGALYFDGADAAEVLHAWSAWSAGLPEQSTTSIALAQLPAQPFIPPALAGRRTVALRYASIADPEQAEGLLAPMRAAATPVLDRVGELAYSDIGRIHDEPDSPVPVQQSQTLLSELPPEAIDALIKAAGPESGSPLLLVELRRLGGALARTPEHASAFSHRHAPYALHTIGLAVPPDQHIVAAAAQATIGSVEPWSSGGMFANFVPTSDPARIATAYDDHTRERLLTLAGHYDPAGILATPGQLGAVRNAT